MYVKNAKEGPLRKKIFFEAQKKIMTKIIATTLERVGDGWWGKINLLLIYNVSTENFVFALYLH